MLSVTRLRARDWAVRCKIQTSVHSALFVMAASLLSPASHRLAFALLSAHGVPDLLLREMGQDPAGAPATMGINNHPVPAFREHQAAPLLPLSIRLQSWELGPCSERLLFLCPYPHSEPCPALCPGFVPRLCGSAYRILSGLEGVVSTKQLISAKHLLCVLQG